MFSRISVIFLSFCLLADAILVYGSLSRDRSTDQQVRNHRHASCTTCSRDCPGTLSSPWYGGHVYEQQANREYRRILPETYRERNKHYYPIQDTSQVSPYPFNQYNRPSGSGGAISTGITATTSGDARQRENTFDQRESRKIDSNVAPTSPAASFAMPEPMNSDLPRANLPINERARGSPHGKSNFYDTINRQRELGIGEDYRNEFNSNGPKENIAASKNIYEEELSNPGKNFFVVYRADRNSQESMEEEDPDEFAPDRSFGPGGLSIRKQDDVSRYPAGEFLEQPRSGIQKQDDLARYSAGAFWEQPQSIMRKQDDVKMYPVGEFVDQPRSIIQEHDDIARYPAGGYLEQPRSVIQKQDDIARYPAGGYLEQPHSVIQKQDDIARYPAREYLEQSHPVIQKQDDIERYPPGGYSEQPRPVMQKQEDIERHPPGGYSQQPGSVIQKLSGIARYPAAALVQQPREDLSHEARGASNMAPAPEVNYNPYNLPVDPNVVKLLQNMGRQELYFNNQNAWQGERLGLGEERAREEVQGVIGMERNGKNDDEEREEIMQRMNDRIRSELPFDFNGVKAQDNSEVKKDKIDKIDGFIVGNTDYVAKTGEIDVEGLSETSSKRNSSSKSREGSFSGIDLDLIEDIEDRPAEATEASPTNPTTESTTNPR